MRGRMLLWSGATWRTTRTAAGRSLGSFATSARRASTPPADAPTTMMSWLGIHPLPASVRSWRGIRTPREPRAPPAALLDEAPRPADVPPRRLLAQVRQVDEVFRRAPEGGLRGTEQALEALSGVTAAQHRQSSSAKGQCERGVVPDQGDYHQAGEPAVCLD